MVYHAQSISFYAGGVNHLFGSASSQTDVNPATGRKNMAHINWNEHVYIYTHTYTIYIIIYIYICIHLRMQTRTDAPTVAQSPANNAWQRFGVQPVGSKKRSKAEDKSRLSVGCLWSLSHGERWEILLWIRVILVLKQKVSTWCWISSPDLLHPQNNHTTLVSFPTTHRRKWGGKAEPSTGGSQPDWGDQKTQRPAIWGRWVTTKFDCKIL